jgi:hypothetical protein
MHQFTPEADLSVDTGSLDGMRELQLVGYCPIREMCGTRASSVDRALCGGSR